MTSLPLVLGPSLGTSADTLWGACAELLRPDVEVVVWDLPGHGTNHDRAPADLTVADLAAGVRRQLDALGVEQFDYAGDSVGGAVGLQLLLDVPERVRSAVLLCTGARIGTPQSWLERIDQVRRSGTSSLVEGSKQRWFGAGFVEREPERAAALLGALQDADDGGYAAVCHALAGFDVRHRLGELRAPVLAVAGAEDAATPPDVLRELADAVPDARLVVLEGVAHLAPAEAPATVADLIRDHVSRATAGGPPA